VATETAAAVVTELGYKIDEAVLARYSKAIDKTHRKTVKVGDAFDRSERQLGSLTKGFGRGIASVAKWGAAIAAAAAAASVALGVKLVSDVATAGDELDKTSKKVGTSVESLQRLRFAADRSGASAETLNKALRDQARFMLEAEQGGAKPFTMAMEELGISLGEFSKLDAEGRFGLIGDALQKVQDPARRTALAMQTVGAKAGPELVPLLLEGSKGIGELGDKLEALGGVMSGKTAAAGAKLKDELTNLNAIWTGIKNQVGGQVIPIVTRVAKKIQAWASENKELINEKLEAFIKGAVDATEFLVKTIGDLVDIFSEARGEVKGADSEFAEWGKTLKDVVEIVVGVIRHMTRLTSFVHNLVADFLEWTGAIDQLKGALQTIKDIVTPDKPVTIEDLQRQAAERQTKPEDAADADQRLRNRAAGIPNVHRNIPEDEFAGPVMPAGGRRGRGRTGGKGGGKELDTSEVERLIGEEIRRLAEQVGVGPQAIKDAFRDAQEELNKGSTHSVVRGAAIGILEQRSGQKNLGQTADELLNETFGRESGSTAGGGESPTSGAKFVRIDASFNSPTNIEIAVSSSELAGLDAEQQADVIDRKIGEIIEERNRRAYEHYRTEWLR
jgi:hypothetical protein